MDIGERIKRRRIKLNLSQEVVAGLAGINQTLISKYELGKHQPTAEVIAAIAPVLETTSDFLLGLTDIPDRQMRVKTDLTSEEQRLIELYRSKTRDSREKALEILKVL